MANPTTPAQAQKDFPDPQSFANFLNQHWPNQRINAKTLGGTVLTGGNVGDQWLNWYATESPNHLNYSLGYFEVVFFDFTVAESLAKGLSKAEVATGQFINQAQNAIQQSNYLPSGLAGIASALAGVGDFFGRLTQASTWIRVAEVILGAGLIIVALAKLAGNTPVGRTAAKAGKAAMIL